MRVLLIVLVVYVAIAFVWWSLAPGVAEWTPMRLNWPAHAYRWARSNLGE